MSKLEKTTWVVIPAHNEEKRISAVLKETKKYADNILVVNDGSADHTSQVANKHKVHVLDHVINLGKGGALKTGCDYALKKGAKIIMVMDADGQHQPKDLPRFEQKLRSKKLDIVFGRRKLNKTMPAILKFGNKAMTLIIQLLYGVTVHDSQSGFRCFSAQAYKKIRWNAADYSMESEMIARVGKHKLKYGEINIATIYLDRYKGTTVLDGIKVVLYMLWWRLTK